MHRASVMPRAAWIEQQEMDSSRDDGVFGCLASGLHGIYECCCSCLGRCEACTFLL